MLAKIFDLTTSSPPVALTDVRIDMIWHRSYGDDQAHCWIRDTLWKVAQIR
ncbi:type 2 periplasmic-binding domain-containing protein [Gluconobacter wancherniae]|uniref:hypothetical protein n=1 Tax=Gluconobacter wancherniae TaxID=1307955 RepID=UPI001E287985|nr:hypothetical protein [Gluconobacter wancherniae]